MIRTSLAIVGILAIGSQLTQAQDTVSVDLVVNNQIRKVVVQLNPEAAPQTCENFKRLAQSGFYKGLAVHRAIPGYIVQMGDPYTKDASQKETWGTGGPDYTVPAEIKLPHIRGAIAMARLPDSRNPNRASNGSQFYFALDDLDHLNGQYTVFGRVVNGIEHLDYISEQTVDTNDVPINRIEISAVTAAGEAAPTKVLAPVAAAASGVVGSVSGDGSGAVREAPAKMLSAATGGVRGAGGAVAGVIPDRISMPKMPSFGRKDSGAGENVDAAPVEEIAEIPVEETAVDVGETPDKKRRLPTISRPKMPSFGRSKDEPVSLEEMPAPEAPATEAPAIRAAIITDIPPETAPVEEDPETGKKRISLRPKKQEEKEQGAMSRAIKRIW